MKYLEQRIRGICSELKNLSVVSKEKIWDFKYKKGNYVYPQDADAAKEQWQDFDGHTMHWYGPDEHYWFRTTYTVSEELKGKEVWLRIKTQIEESEDGKNPQFLLFIDGEEVQGVDMNHRRVLLTKAAKAGKSYVLDLQSYTGVLHSELCLSVEILQIEPLIEELYYDVYAPISAFNRMKNETQKKEIETVLNNCMNYLDLRSPYSTEFYESLRQAKEYIQRELYENLAGYDDVIATCIGHTHIDVAWLWTVEQVREKTGRSFATVLKLMEEYPNYRFMSSQPQLYEFLKVRYPKLYEKVKERIAQGRWEAEGGMWVESDCNLTSGESLVRQFVMGKRFFKEEFGVDNRVLWLPDVFGYSGALPQIMKRSGIDYFMTTKLAWNQWNKIPHDTFMWKGIDGSEVLTHMITTLGIGQDIANFFTTYNGMLHSDAIMGAWERYQDKEINNDILISYGYGDGGGGPTREMLETSKRLEKGIKGIPKVRQEFSRTYFEELEERVKDHKRLSTWEGELYFEYHRGTYTSMARNKRANRKSEFMMMDLELFSILSGNYPKKQLEHMWKLMLRNQFHDILPGTSIHEVYEVTKQEYDEIHETASLLIEERLQTLTKEGDGVTVYNTLGFERDDVIQFTNEIGAEYLVDSEGGQYPVQHTMDGDIVYLDSIPSKGSRSYGKCNAEPKKASPFVIKDNQIDTPFYHIQLDKEGMFTSIIDIENDREILQQGERGNLFRMYEDKPMNYDNWDIDMYYTEKYWDATEVISINWIEAGPVRAAVEITRQISKSVIKQQIYFYGDSRKIEFKTYVDWKEQQHLLKVHFPIAVHTDEATFDIQFGNVTRKIHTNTSWDEARFETCGQKWIDLSEGHYGVSLLNDCKYGHSVKNGNIGLTLIKSGINPNPVADQEEHYFTYALYPHAENWKQGGTVKEAYKLNVPAYGVNQGISGSKTSLASIDKNNIMLETVKQAEDGSGIIFRMYEYENALTKAFVTINMEQVQKVIECNLVEEEEKEIPWCGNGFHILVKPYEIKTYKVVSK